ncbi:hypothetical protein CGL51_13875 [Pyrobaculum aerophilum]|uniref:Uncharacterized protein n=1 Tax=Pyrobaculum aerophilum TaxID=13773 RepID=A0A371QZK7_9CREN|nr:hypothetical protein [Pyrobaculum aerophilum]RFA92827.1 hypothetical protein CGL51_13875 [Pyrobaculum aerophilum]RFA96205.1 hypothetical protein CGL52_11295 [Pyrobaculum aerophilum]
MECDKYGDCQWRACPVELEDLIKAAEEEEGVEIDPDFAKAAYYFRGYGCKLSHSSLEELEKIMRCELDDRLSGVIKGSVLLYLGEYDDYAIWGELEEEKEYKWGCNFSDIDIIVPKLVEDNVVLYTRSWEKALFIWLAFEGELSLYYREYYQHEILRKKAELCEDPALRELYLRAARNAEISRWTVDEYKYKVVLRGDSAYRFAKAMLNLCNFYRSSWPFRGSHTERHCKLAESMRHLAEKAVSPLISEHLRQYWKIKADMNGAVLYPVAFLVEALETGEDHYHWEFKVYKKRE